MIWFETGPKLTVISRKIFGFSQFLNNSVIFYFTTLCQNPCNELGSPGWLGMEWPIEFCNWTQSRICVCNIYLSLLNYMYLDTFFIILHKYKTYYKFSTVQNIWILLSTDLNIHISIITKLYLAIALCNASLPHYNDKLCQQTFIIMLWRASTVTILYKTCKLLTVCSDRLILTTWWPDALASAVTRLVFPTPGDPSRRIGHKSCNPRKRRWIFMDVVGASSA